VAVAVLTYSKDDPSATFAVLGPLTQQASDTTEIRFHLGELLYWLKQDTDAEAQWRQVEQDSPHSPYGRIAARLMQSLSAG
jgi:exonuclease V gamma subunit